jgi:hypothetical protein
VFWTIRTNEETEEDPAKTVILIKDNSPESSRIKHLIKSGAPREEILELTQLKRFYDLFL